MLSRRYDSGVGRDFDASIITVFTLEADFQAQIERSLHWLGLGDQPVHVQVAITGMAEDGREIYSGVVRLLEWCGEVSIRFLSAFPAFQRRVCKAAACSWLNDYGILANITVDSPPEFDVRESSLERPQT